MIQVNNPYWGKINTIVKIAENAILRQLIVEYRQKWANPNKSANRIVVGTLIPISASRARKIPSSLGIKIKNNKLNDR